jgi:AraC-like DNA-binding protein
MQYLTDWRMTLARDHLRTGELGMASIARAVGYSSPYAFAAAFRRHHGEPPGTWRQQESLREQAFPGNDPRARLHPVTSASHAGRRR